MPTTTRATTAKAAAVARPRASPNPSQTPVAVVNSPAAVSVSRGNKGTQRKDLATSTTPTGPREALKPSALRAPPSRGFTSYLPTATTLAGSVPPARPEVATTRDPPTEGCGVDVWDEQLAEEIRLARRGIDGASGAPTASRGDRAEEPVGLHRPPASLAVLGLDQRLRRLRDLRPGMSIQERIAVLVREGVCAIPRRVSDARPRASSERRGQWSTRSEASGVGSIVKEVVLGRRLSEAVAALADVSAAQSRGTAPRPRHPVPLDAEFQRRRRSQPARARRSPKSAAATLAKVEAERHEMESGGGSDSFGSYATSNSLSTSPSWISSRRGSAASYQVLGGRPQGDVAQRGSARSGVPSGNFISVVRNEPPISTH